MVAALKDGFTRLLDFKGRATRLQFWSMWLVLTAVYFVAAYLVVSAMPENSLLGGVVVAVYLVGLLGVGARRLHDQDKPAWWLLIGLIPFIGGLILLVILALPGTKGANRFGPDPLGGDTGEGVNPESTVAGVPSATADEFKQRVANYLRSLPGIESVNMGPKDAINIINAEGISGTAYLANDWRRIRGGEQAEELAIADIGQRWQSIGAGSKSEGVLIPVLRAGDPFMEVENFRAEFVHRPFAGDLTIQIVEDFADTAQRLQTSDMERLGGNADFLFLSAYQNLQRMSESVQIMRKGNVALLIEDPDYSSSLMLLDSVADNIEGFLGGPIMAIPAAAGFVGFARQDDDEAILELHAQAQHAYQNAPRPLTMQRFVRDDGKWVAMSVQ